MDRISELPDCVLHHILSLLPTPDVVRTSVLSRRWNWVLDSFPFWDFNLKYFNRRRRLQEASKKCMGFACHSLRRLTRDGVGSPKINLYVFFDSGLCALLSNCIDLAVDRQVKELTLHTNESYDWYHLHRPIFTMPPSIFASRTLTVLELWGCGFSESLVGSKVGNHTLRKLSLFHCRVSEAELGFLFNCFTFVEDLTIKDCFPVRVVSVSGLPKLKALHVKIVRIFFVVGGVEIDAPALRRLCIDSALIDNDTVGRIFTNCPSMEDFTLVKPKGLVRLAILGSFNVDRLNSYKGVDKRWETDVKVLDLQYSCFPCSPTRRPSLMLEVNVCRPLKEVVISGISVDPEHLSKGLISRFSLLEELRISVCPKLEKIDISSPVLKSIYLDRCRKLEDIRIEASRLHSFQYTSYQAPLSFMVHAPCPLEFVLKPAYKVTWDDSFFLRLNALLSQLDLAAEIKLSIHSYKAIFAVDISELRRRCVSSSRNLDELRIAVGGKKCPDLPSVVDFLLWSCRPRNIWVCPGFQKELIQVLYEKIVGHNPWNVEIKTLELLSKRGKSRSWNFDSEREQLPPLEIFAGLLRNFGGGKGHFTLHWSDTAEQSG